MARDEGNTFVLEGIIISLILLGAAYAVQSLQVSSIENARPRAELGRLVDDALTVLNGLDDGQGTALLDRYLLDAMHCAFDATASTSDCDLRRSKQLSVKLDNYLPLGSGYAIGVGNGVGMREIYRSPLPQGESVGTSRTFLPKWNTTFVLAEMDCYPIGTNINATLIPIDRGRVAGTRWGNVTVDSTEYVGQRANTSQWWNVTLDSGTRPSSGDISAKVTANATAGQTGNASLYGLSAYRTCDHGGKTVVLHDALNLVTFSGAQKNVSVGGTLTFTADLSALAAVSGVTVGVSNVTLYEPLPNRSATADTWLRTGEVVSLTGAANVRTGTFTAPTSALYGAHPAVLRVNVTVGAASFELRRAVIIDIGLPLAPGEAYPRVPIAAPYRVSLQGWLADWG